MRCLSSPSEMALTGLRPWPGLWVTSGAQPESARAKVKQAQAKRNRMASLLRQRERRLAECVAPPPPDAHVGIAEPELVVEVAAPGLRALEPEQRGHDRRIAPHADL